MILKRTALTMFLAVVVAPAARAQTYSLMEAPERDTVFEYRLKLDLNGEITVRQNEKPLSLKQAVQAEHYFVERVLEPGPQNMVQKVARGYRQARVDVVVGEQKSQRTLRPQRSFVVAQRVGEGLLTYCPQGSFTREELEVTEHFDTLALTGLLPGDKQVAIGENWKVHNAVAQALGHLDGGLSSHDLTCKLETVKGDVAEVSFRGAANGIEHGADVQLKIDGSFGFDLKSRRITNLTWNQTDAREQGPVSPAANVKLTTTVERKVIESIDNAREVNNFALVPIPGGTLPPEGKTLVSIADPKGRYDFACARDWQLVGRTDDHLTLRLLDRGKFIAQVSISTWKKLAPGQQPTGEQFKMTISETPNWQQEEMLEAKEVSTPGGPWIYHVAASGKLAGVQALQHFYLVVGPEGDQILLAFTMTPTQVQNLATRDLTLVRSVTFPTPRTNEENK